LAEMARARAAEAERRRQETDRVLAELRRISEERDRMETEAIEAGALRRSDELKTALLRSVSHDLRTPLTSIIAAGAALDSPSVSADERHELSEAVVEQGRRLSRLVENLLDVSRLESGNAEPRREPVDLTGLLEAARESVGAGADEVTLSLDAELPTLVADAVQLERAFANLFENAVHHSDGRPVLVRSRQTGGRLVVRVVDQGPGIPEHERERIFEPFYRRQGAGAAGSGLGLSIARGFVEANGGEIAVESVPGQGSTFVVSFPIDEGTG
jgi:two-component system sensor histidine kinase KdpD